MRTHNEGRVVTGMEGTLMQIDPQRPKRQSLLIKLFTTAPVLCIRDTKRRGKKRVKCRSSAVTQCVNLLINEIEEQRD